MAQSNFTPEEIMQVVGKGKSYTLLMLKTGPTPPPADEAESNRLQMEHLAHLFQMEKEGKSSVFGPIVGNETFRGIIIFNTSNKDEIHEWMADDPWVKSGCLVYELLDLFSIPGQKIAG
jgi:uncharacterized protein YciI